MIISDRMLRELYTQEGIVNPLAEGAIQPNSIDLRLGRYIKQSQVVIEPCNIDPLKDTIDYQLIDLKAPYKYVLPPKTFCLGVTLEQIYVPQGFTATIEGKSSIGRVGLFVVNAGRADTGYRGHPTLELFNGEDYGIVLTFGMFICQIVYSNAQFCDHPYGSAGLNSHYQGDILPEESRMWKR